MGRFSVQVPNLLGGVSQQAANIRLVGQAESMVNAYPSIVDGLMRRHPVEHIEQVDDPDDAIAPPANDHVHLINRDPDERYMVLVRDPAAFAGFGGPVRVIELADGTEVPVFGPLGAAADFDYLEGLDTDDAPPNVNVKCVTIADYTLVLNRTMAVALADDLTAPDPSDTEGFLFVRAGNYKTTYRAFIKELDTEYEVKVTTWDGVAAAAGTVEEWELTVNSVGAVGEDWVVSDLGQTATYTVAPGDTTTDIANELQPLVDALTGVDATDAANVLTIAGETAGVHFLPAVTPPTGGSYGLVNTAVAEEADELTSIDTGDIAQALADEINGLLGTPFTATRIGAVVRVVSSEVLTSIRVEDGHEGTDFIKVHKTIPAIDQLPLVGVDGFTIRVDGDTANTADDYYATFRLDSAATEDEWELTIVAEGTVGKTWKVTTLGELYEYTVQTGDTPEDVADAIAALVDAGSNVSAAAVGAVVTITADDAGPKLVPVVDPPTGGSHTLVHTTDSVGTFGAGKWVEGRGFALPVGLDPLTMPHRLIRRQDDADGTVTGTAFGKWFEWSPAEWDERAAGDRDTAPDPSIVGSVLEDMFFFRDRLGFTSGQKVVMSGVSRFFNLYRTTVLSLPDGDPIDITVPSTSVVRIHRAVPIARRLILFADDVQFVLEGDPLLTPRTVQVSAVSKYQSDSDAEPLADADGVFFGSSRGTFSGVRRLFPQENIDGQFLSEDTTVAVPQYIPGPLVQMATVEPEGLLVCLAEDERNALYLYKTYRVGDRQLQSAWFRYELGSADDTEIQGFGVIGNALYLLVWRENGTNLEVSRIQSDLVDDGADYLTHLDRRVRFDSGAYSGITGRTTWVLPYRADSNADHYAVVRSTTGVDGGDVYPLTIDASDQVSTDVSAQGDHSAESVWAGQAFETRYEFSRLYLKTDAPAGGQALRTGGRLQVLHGSLDYERTASLKVEVTPQYQPTETASATFSGLSIDEALQGSLSLPADEFRFPVYSADAKVEIVADGPLPMAIQAAQFEVEWAPRMGLYRGQ